MLIYSLRLLSREISLSQEPEEAVVIGAVPQISRKDTNKKLNFIYIGRLCICS